MRECINLTTSDNGMLATIIIHPPVDEEEITFEAIQEVIAESGIVHGINEDIMDVIKNGFEFNIVYEIAKGIEPKDGKDGKAIYYFNTDNKNAKPSLNEDGSVDFHNLNLINNVKQDDVLVKIKPEVEGESGLDIFGKEVPPPPVTKAVLPKYGPHIKKSEDELSLISEVDGHVEFISNKIIVNEVLTIQGDVDNSTGDINYNGSVMVTGNVLSGFSVKAKKNIEIMGLVEGANLLASGNIIIRGGVQGMDKARIICAGTLVSKYIANAFVKANGSINTNSILHSQVSSNDVINVNGKGLISGGKVRANRVISAKTIGTHLGTKTNIEVGVDPDIVEKFQEFKEKLSKQEDELKKLNQIIRVLEDRRKKGVLSDDRRLTLEKSYSTKESLTKEIKTCKNIINNLAPLMENVKSGKIKIASQVFPGVVVTIGSQSMVVRNQTSRCSLVIDGGEVRVAAY